MADLSSERVDYVGEHLLESAAPSDPYTLFRAWLTDALAARNDGEPTAMVLATCSGGRPAARSVLLKELRADGFVFFTSYDSAKAADIAANPLVALHFGWQARYRQVRIEGAAERLPRADSEAYFATRPRGSQLGAWASRQSSPVAGLESLQEAYQAAEARFATTDVPCPETWGGYLVRPSGFEFWQGQPSRMHDRLAYRRADGRWEITRLAP